MTFEKASIMVFTLNIGLVSLVFTEKNNRCISLIKKKEEKKWMTQISIAKVTEN